MTTENPLLQEWSTPFAIPPFEKIRPEHFKPAVEEAISLARKEIDHIVSDQAEPDFRNTVEALEHAGSLLNRITPVLFNLNSSDTTPELQEAAREVSPVLTAFSNDISLNPALFARVKSIYEKRDSLGLNKEEMILLDRKYKNFIRGGAGLADAEQERFRAITVELSTLSLKFEENVLAETNDYTLHLKDEDDLSGLPEGVREAAEALAREKGREGWLFTLHAPSFVPFMQYADRRDLREKIFRAYSCRAFRGNEHDNRELVSRIQSSDWRWQGCWDTLITQHTPWRSGWHPHPKR